MLPWPKGCKIWQTADYCNTYEISDEGNYIASCELAMFQDQCLVSNTSPNICLEECPDGSCIQEEVAAHLKMALALSALTMSSLFV